MSCPAWRAGTPAPAHAPAWECRARAWECKTILGSTVGAHGSRDGARAPAGRAPLSSSPPQRVALPMPSERAASCGARGAAHGPLLAPCWPPAGRGRTARLGVEVGHAAGGGVQERGRHRQRLRIRSHLRVAPDDARQAHGVVPVHARLDLRAAARPSTAARAQRPRPLAKALAGCRQPREPGTPGEAAAAGRAGSAGAGLAPVPTMQVPRLPLPTAAEPASARA